MGKLFLFILLIFVWTAFPLSGRSFSPSSLEALKHIKAEKWQIAGGNYVVSGHVTIKYEDFVLSCDRAIVNPSQQDVEASGNCRLIRWKTANRQVTVRELAELERKNDVRVTVEGICGNVFGERKLSVKLDYISESVQCQKITGNLKSGYFRFDRLRLKTTSIVCRADSGERLPNGVLELSNGEVSSCSYLEADNAHFSIGASKIKLTPYKSGFYGAEHIDKDFDDHMVTLWHGIGKIYGLPVFYFPLIWKPRDEDPGLAAFHWGKQSDWGYFFSFYKRFVFSQYPYSKIKIRTDWYTRRGVGFGAEGQLASESSRTDFFAYGIYDLKPNESEDYDDYRIKVPHFRYDFRVSHLSHITPRLDFRGVMEYASDPYFVRDFFNARFTSDPEPATYAALEQQFDHLTAALYFRPRLMKSYTTVEKMPELTLLGQRQQIGDLPLYYQGDLTAGYYRMKWIDFDEKLKGAAGSRLHDYDAFRLDTTHFLYLPWRTRYFVLTPRAGFKLTSYSRTSDHEVKEQDLVQMLEAASPTNTAAKNFRNYDEDGGSKVRFLGELGAELSTKVHKTWSDARNKWMQLDGVRHIMRPYINYTFITSPTVNRDHLYYFDEIDRIERQSFFRFGLENRLQTRDGNKLREWLRLENFIDIHTTNNDDVNAIGDFCTLLTVTPVKGLTISTQIMIDAGGNNKEMPDHIRHGRNVGRPGIDVKWINRWNVAIRYTPIQDFVFTFAYDYIRPYGGRMPYSMGSTLTLMESSRWFRKDFYKHEETFSLAVELPITPDRRTFAGFAMAYDFLDGHVSSYRFMLRRIFHCVELTGTLAFEYDSDEDEKHWETNFTMGVKFTGLDSPILQNTNSVLSSAASKGGTAGFTL